MKLFFINENLMPHETGGGYYAIFKFAEFLAQRGHQVVIYAVHDLGWLQPNENLKIIYRPHLPRKNRVFRKIDKWIDRVCDRTHLEQSIRSFQPDFLLGVLKESAIKAVKMGKRTQIPVANFVYECPLWLEEAGGDRFKNKYKGYFKQLWEETKIAYKETDILFPNSLLAGEYIHRWLDGKPVAEPIYPGIDIDDQAAMKNTEGSSDSSELNILYIGRLALLKNVDLLISAVKKSQTRPICHIVGSGPEKDRLIALADGDPRIKFHGFVSDSELWNFIRNCQLVAYPTSFEGFGMPPMQAFFAGKPCIASDIPILRSIYGDTLDYYPHGDEAALIQKIDELLSNPDYCTKRGEEGEEFVLNRFTWEKSAERIEANLDEWRQHKTFKSCDFHLDMASHEVQSRKI